MKVEYWSKGGQWYWHAKSPNGRVLCDGGEGYHNRKDMLTTIGVVVEAFASGDYTLTPIERGE